MKFQFIENIDSDIKNWQDSVAIKSYGVDWKKFLPPDLSLEDIKNTAYLKKYLEEKYYESGKISEFKEWLESNVRPKQIQEDLEGLVGKKFPFEKIRIFITTFHRAPYNIEEKFFYLIFRDSQKEKAITSIYHELMHFLFHIYFWDKCKEVGIPEERIHIIKESLTVLLNPILAKRELPADRGYVEHRDMRKQLEKIWDSRKSFESFLLDFLSYN